MLTEKEQYSRAVSGRTFGRRMVGCTMANCRIAGQITTDQFADDACTALKNLVYVVVHEMHVTYMRTVLPEPAKEHSTSVKAR